jgi:SPP1 family predicted phage head-tail adaptor
MEAGKLRHRLMILAPVRTESATGARSPTSWDAVATVWGSVAVSRAAEGELAKQQAHQTNYDVVIRYRDDVTSDCRLVYRGETLTISGVENVEGRNRELRITAVGG